jgi:hypothetical protein
MRTSRTRVSLAAVLPTPPPSFWLKVFLRKGLGGDFGMFVFGERMDGWTAAEGFVKHRRLDRPGGPQWDLDE